MDFSTELPKRAPPSLWGEFYLQDRLLGGSIGQAYLNWAAQQSPRYFIFGGGRGSIDLNWKIQRKKSLTSRLVYTADPFWSIGKASLICYREDLPYSQTNPDQSGKFFTSLCSKHRGQKGWEKWVEEEKPIGEIRPQRGKYTQKHPMPASQAQITDHGYTYFHHHTHKANEKGKWAPSQQQPTLQWGKSSVEELMLGMQIVPKFSSQHSHLKDLR